MALQIRNNQLIVLHNIVELAGSQNASGNIALRTDIPRKRISLKYSERRKNGNGLRRKTY
jgi:hypothetical protein